MQTYIHVAIYICKYIYVCIYIYIYLHTYVCVFAQPVKCSSSSSNSYSNNNNYKVITQYFLGELLCSLYLSIYILCMFSMLSRSLEAHVQCVRAHEIRKCTENTGKFHRHTAAAMRARARERRATRV